MPSESAVTCPSCGAALPTTGLKPGVLVQCARCNWQFRLGEAVPAPASAGTPPVAPLPPPGSEGTSGLAITSFVLGLVPCFCLTGIPAILCGAFSLGEITKSAGRLSGTVLAWLGIILGSFWTLMCAAGVGGVIWLGKTIERNVSFFDDPALIARTAEDIGVPDVPDGIEPFGGGDSGVFGIRGVLYGDDKNNPNAAIIVVQFPGWFPWGREQMEEQTRQIWNQNQQQGTPGFRIEEERTVNYTVRGEELLVKELIGKDSSSGRRVREYIAMMKNDDKPLFVIVHTVEPPEDATKPDTETEPTEPGKAAEKPPTEPGDMPPAETVRKAVHLTEEQVKKFFESFP